MAAPQGMKIDNLTGVWVLEKSLSNELDQIFQLQGINWMVRKALKTATVSFVVEAYKDEKDLNHMIVQQSVGFGPSPPPEHRLLDWSEVPRQTMIGSMTGRTRFVNGAKNSFGFANPSIDMQTNTGDAAKNLEAQRFLRGEIAADGTKMDGFLMEGDVEKPKALCVHHFNTNDSGWTGEEVWGFETVEGVRRLTRRLVVNKNKDKKTKMARMVFTYQEKKA